jgi:hypothetical protein
MRIAPGIDVFFEWLESLNPKPQSLTLAWLRANAPAGDLEPLFRWLEIRETNGQDIGDWLQLRIDADHSGLLQRILKGGFVAPEAPPTACSYPWADLIKTGKGEPFEVWEPHPENSWAPKDTVIIDQSWWYLIERLGEDDYIVTYKTPDVERIAKERAAGTWSKVEGIPMKASSSRWRVHSPGPHPRIPERKAWVIERLQ